MELLFDVDSSSSFLLHLICDGQDGRLGSSDCLLRAAAGDLRDRWILRAFVNVDLCTRLVLDLVDIRASFTKDTSNRLGRYSELD